MRAVDALFVVSGLDESIRASVVASESETAADIRWLSTLDEALEYVEEVQLDHPLVVDDGAEGRGELSDELTAIFDDVSPSRPIQ